MMEERIKIGLSLIVIGILILSSSILVYNNINNDKEDTPENTSMSIEIKLATNFCGGSLLLIGIAIIVFSFIKKL